jgi:hypothetical protein
MTQGKCKTCKVRWTWQGARSIRRGIRCPCCGAALEKTTHLLTWRTRLTTKAQVSGRPSYSPHCCREKGCQSVLTNVQQTEIDRLDCNDTGFPREGSGLHRGL